MATIKDNRSGKVLSRKAFEHSDESAELANSQYDQGYKEGYEAGAAQGGGSGGEGVKTCNVRFYKGWLGEQFAGVYAYTKLVDGKLQPTHLATYETVADYDITLENVVCGTVICFCCYGDLGVSWVYDESCIELVDPEGNIANQMMFIVKPDATDTELTTSW